MMVKNQEKELLLNNHKNYVEEKGHERTSQQQDQSLLESWKLMHLNSCDQEKAITNKEDRNNQGVSSLHEMQKLHVDSLGLSSNRINQKQDISRKNRQTEFNSSFDKMELTQNVGGKRKYTGWDSSNDERNSKERSIRNFVMKDISKERRKRVNRKPFERDEKRMNKLEKYKTERCNESRRLSRDHHRRLERRSESRNSRNRDRRIPRRSPSKLSKHCPRRLLRRRGHGRSPIRENEINQRIRHDKNYERSLRKEEKFQHELQNITIPKLETECEILQGVRNHVNNRNDLDDDKNQNSRFILVRNIPLRYDLDELLARFSQYGFLVEFGFIDQNLFIAYKNTACAKRAVQEEYGKMYLGQVLKVNFCKHDFPFLQAKERMMTLPNNSISLREQSRSLSESTSLERKVALRIVVKGLDRSVSLQDLKNFGQMVGPLNLVIILEDSSRELFGVIEYKLSVHVEKALDTLKYKRLNGKEVSIRRYNESYEFGYREIEEMQCRNENRPNPENCEEKYVQSKEKRNYGEREKLVERSYRKEEKSKNEKKYRSRERISRSRDRNSKPKTAKRENDVELIPKENFYRSVKKPNGTKRYMGDINNEMNRRKQVRSRSLMRIGKRSKGEISREFPNRESYLLRKEPNRMILPKRSSFQIDKKMKNWEREKVHMQEKNKFSTEKNARDRERKRELEKMTTRNKERMRMHLTEDNKECTKHVETKERRKIVIAEQKKEHKRESSSHEIVKPINEKVAITREMKYREITNKNESLSTTDAANSTNSKDQQTSEKQIREIEEKLRFQIKQELRVENESKLRIEIEKELRVEIEEKLRKEHEEILKNKLNEILRMHNEAGIQMENLYPLMKGKCQKQESVLVRNDE